jgi:hypothetical protein
MLFLRLSSFGLRSSTDLREVPFPKFGWSLYSAMVTRFWIQGRGYNHKKTRRKNDGKGQAKVNQALSAIIVSSRPRALCHRNLTMSLTSLSEDLIFLVCVELHVVDIYSVRKVSLLSKPFGKGIVYLMAANL